VVGLVLGLVLALVVVLALGLMVVLAVAPGLAFVVGLAFGPALMVALAIALVVGLGLGFEFVMSTTRNSNAEDINARARRDGGHAPKTRRRVVCDYCGAEFETVVPSARFCPLKWALQDCRALWHAERYRQRSAEGQIVTNGVAICAAEDCSVEFKPRNKRQRFCSQKCRRGARG
jgi:hypothetical protein